MVEADKGIILTDSDAADYWSAYIIMNNNKPSDPIIIQDGNLPEVLLEDEKVDIKHEEDARAKGLTAYSRFEGLSRRAALRVYWLSTFWACAAGIGALFDGFVIVSKSLRKLYRRTWELSIVLYQKLIL